MVFNKLLDSISEEQAFVKGSYRKWTTMGMEGMSSWDIPALVDDDDLSSSPVAMNSEQKYIFFPY